jgi:hypothetical protein
MKSKITHLIWAIGLLCLFAPSLSAQPFQNLYAYMPPPGPAIEAGTYFDVTCLNYIGVNNVNVVAIGQSVGTTIDATVSYKDGNGIPMHQWEWWHPAGNQLIGETSCQLPTGDIIVCFYDQIAGATDVARTDIFGNVLWTTRLPNFQVRDVDSDWHPAYPSAEAIFLTGHSVGNQQLAIQGLDAAGGAQMFANEYFLFDPLWNYASATGFQIEYDPATNNIIVVGTGTVAGMGKTNMLYVKTGVFGGWILGRSYGGPPATEFYHGKALVAHPMAPPGNYVLSFEHSNNGTSAFDQVGMTEVTPNGTPIWFRTYPGAGYFNSTNFISNGIDTDGNNFLSSGFFPPVATAPPAAYTLAVDFGGNGLQYNEYNTGTFWPHQSSSFWGMDFNTVTNHQYIDGHYSSTTSPGGWPQGPNPNSFYMVAANGVGNSLCDNGNIANQIDHFPNVPWLNTQNNMLPPQVPSPLLWQMVNPKNITQCTPCKRAHDGGEAQAESAGQVLITYAANAQQIQFEIVGEATGEGFTQVVDMNGKVLAERSLTFGKITIDASTISAGIYFVRYNIPGIDRGVKKLLVN